MKRLIGSLVVFISLLDVAYAAEPVWVELNLVDDWNRRDLNAKETLWQLQGTQQARADIAAGNLKVKTFGLLVMDDWRRKRDRLLARYGIVEQNLGCSVDDKAGHYVTTYNVEMNKEIERRYGSRFWARFDVELQTFEATPNKLLQPIASKRAPR